MNTEMAERELASRDGMARFSVLLGAGYMVAGTALMWQHGSRQPLMTLVYCAYVLFILTPLVYACLRGYIALSVRRAIQSIGVKDGNGALGVMRAWISLPALLLLLGIVYVAPLLVASSQWPQVGASLDTAGLGPLVWIWGIAYLLYAHSWRRRGRRYFIAQVAEAGIDISHRAG